jgi:uncharacterized protein YqgV (UPF0045/DUF77 family)
MTISAQIQFIPLHSDSPMDRVDEAIAISQASGVRNSVGPFGTSIEGEQGVINELVLELQNLKNHPRISTQRSIPPGREQIKQR